MMPTTSRAELARLLRITARHAEAKGEKVTLFPSMVDNIADELDPPLRNPCEEIEIRRDPTWEVSLYQGGQTSTVLYVRACSADTARTRAGAIIEQTPSLRRMSTRCPDGSPGLVIREGEPGYGT